MNRIRKAIVAAIIAGVGPLLTAWFAGGPTRTDGEIAQMIGGAIATAILAGIATYKTRNVGTVNGSDPLPANPSRTVRFD